MKLVLFCMFIVYAVFNKAQASGRDCTHQRKITAALGGDKTFVNCIGYDVVSGQSDLIVMIDRSNNAAYQIAKHNVQKLLTEIKISFNSTRIAVITFDKHALLEIDFLRNPKPTNNKCEFNHLFGKLPRQSGSGSNIRGALNRALYLFDDLLDYPIQNKYRKRANQVAILLSDGKGTHYAGSGDPKDASPEANRFK